MSLANPDVGHADAHHVLNFLHAARPAKTTWCPQFGVRIALVVTKSDGMMIRRGLMVDQRTGLAFGLASGPVGTAMAERINSLSDRDLKAFLDSKEGRLVSEMEEEMVTSADGSVSGLVGVGRGTGSEKAADVLTMRASMWRGLTRPCSYCLKRAHDQGGRVEAAVLQCDSYCEDCAALPSGECAKHLGFGYWAFRPCSHATKANEETYRALPLAHVMDACGAQLSAALAADQLGKHVMSTGSREVQNGDGTSGKQWTELLRAVEADKDLRAYLLEQPALMSDGPHDVKNAVNGSFNWWQRVEGSLVGFRLLEVIYNDIDSTRRDALRQLITLQALRHRNKFSVEDSVEVIERRVQELLAALPPNGLPGVDSLVVATIAPENFRHAVRNPQSACRAPWGMAWDPESGVMLYVDKLGGCLRRLKVRASTPIRITALVFSRPA